MSTPDLERLAARLGPGRWATVIVATFNRPAALRRLVEQLGAQTIPAERYEVIVVDDGSEIDAREALASSKVPCRLHVMRQENAGAAVARQRAADAAEGRILVVVDDDMQVEPTFLAEHLRHHDGRDDLCALGRLAPDAALEGMPLFEKFFASMLERRAGEWDAGAKVVGADVYTGNVSVAKALFDRAGGFDASFRALEDEELGIRLEKAGARFTFASGAVAVHASDKTDTTRWLARGYRDGQYATKIAKKHPDVRSSSPWRHLGGLNPVSRPLMLLTLASPELGHALAGFAIRAAQGLDRLGLSGAAIKGATVVYGVEYYRGVRKETGGVLDVARAYREFQRGLGLLASGGRLGGAGVRAAFEELAHGVREDHAMVRFYAGKYDGRAAGGGAADAEGASLAGDAVKKIGLQIMVAYRVMRFFRAAGLGLAAQLASRLIRHLYGSDIHWDAELAPGVVIVHGFGLAISYAAKVDRGCILYQNVTLGFGTDAERRGGAPHLREDVHVGIGATLFGPIEVGAGTKIMAGCVLRESVGPRSVVEAPTPGVSARAPARSV